ncbi:methyltransferase domain-containing protein [Streptomyces sp. WI04-05B]|uniref:methyltransferase domain-containing protein n=1 Tax=Streptomyces TaxID=1883 RepID=UPI0029AD441B|nr:MULTISPECIES: methyltransferase domain-containing protein [unclassified Streptomyces]MDX2546534.1 methyltransferase domain-containing protein [Streptomyces sp. WI04-05B]MDX2587834.1 methyltransferase domain-containing protein [Streptomyces sp. WI04-05A]MDX3751568.1 methyltransferase domain-containing protein [Streptomyces sp. AK08-02]
MTVEQSPAPSDVRDVYDGFGRIYGSVWGPNIHYGYWENDADDSSVEVATDRLTDLMISGLGAQAGQRVLDIGCGIGHPAQRLVRACDVNVVGITVSHVQAQEATEHAAEAGLADRATFRFGDAMDMPFPDGSFDAAWAFESMWHMPDRGHVLSEAARVLRPGGRLAIADVIQRDPVSPEGRVVLDHICENYAVRSLGTVDEYRVALAANGFVDVEIRDITDNVIRTLGLMADAFETVRDKLADLVGKERADSLIDFVRRFGSIPESGYLFLTAVRA